jgi:hypothetical protein
MKAPKPETAGAYLRGGCKTAQVAYSNHLQESRHIQSAPPARLERVHQDMKCNHLDNGGQEGFSQ